MRISDWSSDVCSSDLITAIDSDLAGAGLHPDAGDCVLPAASRIGAAELVEFLLTEWRSFNRRFRDRCCWHRSVSSSRSDDVLQVGKDRKRVVQGKRVSVRGDIGGRRHIKKKKK